MLETVQCPHCGRKLAVESKHLGGTVSCPVCKKSFTPATDALPVAEAEDIPTAETVQKPRPPAPKWTSSEPGRDFADRIGIDTTERHDEAVLGKTTAQRSLEDWKEHMPEVPPAYQPSGKMPAGSVLAMIAGSGVGAVGGALTFLVAFSITVLLTGLLAALIVWMGEACGRVLCIVVLLAIVVGLIGAGLSYAALGWAAAAITTGAGQMAKNRNTTAAVLFSLVAAFGALGLAHFGADWMSNRFLEWLDPAEAAKPPDKQWGWLIWVEYGVEGLGSVIALFAAGWFGSSMVKESKFCEECEEYMGEEKKPGLHLGAAKAMTAALRENELEAAAELLDTKEGKSAHPTLYCCEKCGKGYLEVQAKFKCTWTKGSDNEEMEEEWLAASVPLEPDEVTLFRKKRREVVDED